MALSEGTRSKCRNCQEPVVWVTPADTFVRVVEDIEHGIEERVESVDKYPEWWHIAGDFEFDPEKFATPKRPGGPLDVRNSRKYDGSRFASETRFGPVFRNCLKLPAETELWNPQARPENYCCEQLESGSWCNRPVRDPETMMCGIHAPKEHERRQERERAQEARRQQESARELREYVAQQMKEKMEALNNLWDLKAERPRYGYEGDRIEVSWSRLEEILAGKVEIFDSLSENVPDGDPFEEKV